MLFKNIIGQDAIKKQLISAANSEKVSQAMLFLGNTGVGKLSMALAFAQYLNCQKRGLEESCGTCYSCLKASKYIHPDIFFTYPTITSKKYKKPIAQNYIGEWRNILAESTYLTYENWIQALENENKAGNITAEECMQIIRQHSLRHFEGKYKIQIIWGAEFLKKEGNKLLKIIEEPPENTVFILIAQHQKDILPTILSRTQIVKFPLLSIETIANKLSAEFSIEKEKALKIGSLSEGSWLEAVQLNAETSLDYFQDTIEWLRILVQLSRRSQLEQVKKLNNWINKIGTSGRQNQKLFLKYLLQYFRECLNVEMGMPSSLAKEELAITKKLISIINWDTISEMSQLINNLHNEILRNSNAKIGLMNLSIKAKKLLQKT